MTRVLAALLLLVVSAWAENVEVRVLELLHPASVKLAAPLGGRTALDTAQGRVWLEGSRMHEATLVSGRIVVYGPVRVLIADKFAREYPGRLTLEPAGEELKLVVTLSLEQAVAAIVAAEAGPEAPEEARKAQAIATRSFLRAGKGRHDGYDFCDTSHCHHLTETNEASSAAASATRGLTVTYAGDVIEALSTRSCAGTTRTLAQIGLDSSAYPYFPATCEPCRRMPSPWNRQWPLADVEKLVTHPGWESARLDVVRRLGWSAVPSNVYDLNVKGGRADLSGRGEGHGVGLCQFGAAELARQGWDAARILALYFANTTLVGTVR
jgi:stage II sporulation protein D